MLDPSLSGLPLFRSLECAANQSREISWEEAEQMLSSDQFGLLKMFRDPPPQTGLSTTRVKVEKKRTRKRTKGARCEDSVQGLLFAGPLPAKTPRDPLRPADCHHGSNSSAPAKRTRKRTKSVGCEDPAQGLLFADNPSSPVNDLGQV